MKTFHWRKIETSEPLQMMLDILKQATRPLTGLEIQEEFRRRGKYCVNPGTTVGELGHNPGYVTRCIRVPLPGDPRRQEYRYALIEAPGYRNSAMLQTAAEESDTTTPIHRGDAEAQRERQETTGTDAGTRGRVDAEPKKKCSYSKCDVMLERGFTCSDDHYHLWRQELKDAAFGAAFGVK